ncbi:MAG: excinuclease ABC subunit UvrA [Planctomycetes bacterium]|nr:excinuclease ABC subunit UvrA [Planctomycetota bacterium]
MKDGLIQIRKARQNNLAGVDVDIPQRRLVAITGVSGSGKSSLAFDTLFREGQRRFLETLSAYARQFLGRMEKPDVESIEGLSPAIAVDQKSVSRGARSTVGTLTEITDHLRVLYARAGRAHCPKCKLPVQAQTPEEITRQILAEFAGQNVHLLAPRIRDKKGHHAEELDTLRKKGFVRARIDGEVKRLEEAGELARYVRHTIEVVVDRMKLAAGDPTRLREALAQALELSGGDVIVLTDAGERAYSTSRACSGCGTETPPLEPRLFSFNSPHGACPSAAKASACAAGRPPRPSCAIRRSSIRDGALAVTRASGGALLFPHVGFDFLEQVAEASGFDLDTPWNELSKDARAVILHGTGDERFEDEAQWNGKKYSGSVRWMRRFPGVLPAIEKASKGGLHKQHVQRYIAEERCKECEGSRLKPAASAVLLGGLGLGELSALPIDELGPRLRKLELTARERTIARDLLNEIDRRVEFLLEVGLGYLTLDRAADTLSGGEAQRIRLAAQLGAGLSGVLYVLDEPSIGLHPRDHGRLIRALERLRDLGNTVVVVEHDESTLRAADWLIDIGPGAGRHGGHLIGNAPPREIAKLDTPTGMLLRGALVLEAPSERRKGNGNFVVVEGARGFNLKDIDVSFPLGTFTAVTGVSGSGKSTLVNRILVRALERKLGREAPQPETHDRLKGAEHVDELVTIDATPIGRTPRSNPATYTGVFTAIRDLFAALPEAKLRGYQAGRFSFNVAGGRCETCGGAGAQYVELQFLAPVTVPCEECGGHRFQAETLDVRFKEKSIADVLAMTSEEALAFFRDLPKIARPLEVMVEIGLGYLTLGQPSTTLSGGEAQRLKLVTELQRRPRGHTVYVLDEPTTGLHMQDVARLVAALQKLVDLGHTVIVIEHNLELVQAADHVIDLGPEGGGAGGKLVAQGTPEELERARGSHTGAALKAFRDQRTWKEAVLAPTAAPAPATSIEVRGARTHNLKNVDVSIPRDALTVITGPSGSGKSSLALDTIYTEGRRRFVESLSTYARQFLGTKDRPPVDRIDGLGPAVAVEARGMSASPRSTVATTTEILDHVRVLWARAGTRRCPTHGHELVKSDASRVTKKLLAQHAGKTGWLVAPIFGPGREHPADLSAAFASRAKAWKTAGFVRALVDGVEVRFDTETPTLPKDAEDVRVDLVLDRLTVNADSRPRIAEGVDAAGTLSGGRVSFVEKGGGARGEYGTRGTCPDCGFQIEEALEPRHFSFNTHVGACPACDGLGEKVECTVEKLFAHPELSVFEGAVGGKLARYLVKGKGYYENLLRTVARAHKVDLAKPWKALTDDQRALVAHGVGAKPQYTVKLERTTTNAEIEEQFTAAWPGLCGHVDAWHQKTEDPDWAAILETVMEKRTCSVCKGERLRPESAAVTVGRVRMPELTQRSVDAALAWATELAAQKTVMESVGAVVEEIRSRLALLARVGLGYLTLDRGTATLSGGEARRVRLASSLGSQLVGVCYVLDEPTVGLHPRDVEKLTDALCDLRDRGNTLLVVEHDTTLMRRADWIVDLGPSAGRLGGEIVASAPPSELEKHPTSKTAAALRGELGLERARPAVDARARGDVVKLTGARLHNLKGVDIEFAFGELTGVCGPSGSGKSTLVLDVLVPALEGEAPRGRWKRLAGLVGGSARVVVVDASPIGRSPASVPATYTGLMEPLRELFARTPEARMKGFEPARFSFNSTKGRCPACEGKGATQVEMQFLADLWLPCEDCDGKRYAPEVLEVTLRGKSIADVLELTVDEALEFFAHQPAMVPMLESLRDVGLGYLQLGQSSTTLSGGEAQRVKLASELFRAETSARSILVLDEPSTGLAASDVVHLARVFDRLAAKGNAVIVIEHHTGLLELCDRLVEIGPEGGDAGGRVIAEGSPRELARDPRSVTGPFLFREPTGAGAATPPRPKPKAGPRAAPKETVRPGPKGVRR